MAKPAWKKPVELTREARRDHIEEYGFDEQIDPPGEELRRRIKELGLTYARAAERLGLTLNGLNKQMSGDRRVSKQTEIILGYLEKEHQAEQPPLRGKKGRAG
jgi:hypothetical protein